MFQINYNKLIVWLTSFWLRKPVILLILKAWISPLKDVFNSFERFVDDKLYRLNHNSQVCYLRAVLNDKFDLTLRRILITNFVGKVRLYFWPETDRRDVDFSITRYFYADVDYADSGIDFTVKIPSGVANTDAELARLKSQINEYKLPGKNYNIVAL